MADELGETMLKKAAKVARNGCAEALAYTEFPREHWRRIRVNSAGKRPSRETCGRARVVGTFPRLEVRPHARDRQARVCRRG